MLVGLGLQVVEFSTEPVNLSFLMDAAPRMLLKLGTLIPKP